MALVFRKRMFKTTITCCVLLAFALAKTADAAPHPGRKLLFGGLTVEKAACQVGAGILFDGGALVACTASVGEKLGSSSRADKMCKNIGVSMFEHGVTAPMADDLCDCVLDEPSCTLQTKQSLECSSCTEVVDAVIAAVEGAGDVAVDVVAAAPCAGAIAQFGLDPIFDFMCTVAIGVVTTVTDDLASHELTKNGYGSERVCNQIKSNTCSSSATNTVHSNDDGGGVPGGFNRDDDADDDDVYNDDDDDDDDGYYAYGGHREEQ